MKHLIYFIPLFLIFAACKPSVKNTEHGGDRIVAANQNSKLNVKEHLGKLLFFEESLSTPPGQDCGFCHDPAAGFSNPEYGLPVSRGARPGCFGNRNDMTAAYAAFVPPLQKNEQTGEWFGGLFWDGRANTLFDQAQGPPLNPLEMANPNRASIANVLRTLRYANLFTEVFGADALTDTLKAYQNMAYALEAYMKSKEVCSFSSKYDQFLAGKTQLSKSEMRGLEIFESKEKGNCAKCHPTKPSQDGTPPVFSNFTYDNLGVPKNPENPFYKLSADLNREGFGFTDKGLGSVVKDPAQDGKFRVPTLRNIAVSHPYMHNGIFKTLHQVISFYSTRDMGIWGNPEVPETVNKKELGNLKLSNEDIDDLVAFLNTLTDGWKAQ